MPPTHTHIHTHTHTHTHICSSTSSNCQITIQIRLSSPQTYIHPYHLAAIAKAQYKPASAPRHPPSDIYSFKQVTADSCSPSMYLTRPIDTCAAMLFVWNNSDARVYAARADLSASWVCMYVYVYIYVCMYVYVCVCMLQALI